MSPLIIAQFIIFRKGRFELADRGTLLLDEISEGRFRSDLYYRVNVYPITGPGFLILDEIHKYSRWRQVVKGLLDKRGKELQIPVTGSARLDYYHRGGDSLQGRYHF